jgi:hypothetical protein
MRRGVLIVFLVPFLIPFLPPFFSLSVLVIFPLTYLIAPVVGLLAYSFGLLVWWRRYVGILIASLLPAVVSVLIYLLYFADLPTMEMSVVTSHVVIKMLLARFVQEHIAMILLGNDMRNRKRLRKHGGEPFSENGLSPVFSARAAESSSSL